MTRLSLDIDFSQVRDRISLEMSRFKPSEWARIVGVSKNIVANIHGKTQQKPSFEYITAVSLATGKSMDYLLWGVEKENHGSDSSWSGNKNPERLSENEIFDSLGMAEGMGLLAKIYASADSIFIRAINANLMAFSDAVENKAKVVDMEKRMQEMESDLAEMKRYIMEMKQQEGARDQSRKGEPSPGQKAA